MKQQTNKLYVLFGKELDNQYGFPKRCWGAIIYNYWNGGEFPRRLEIRRLLQDISSGELGKKTGFGPKLIEEMINWKAQKSPLTDDDIPGA